MRDTYYIDRAGLGGLLPCTPESQAFTEASRCFPSDLGVGVGVLRMESREVPCSPSALSLSSVLSPNSPPPSPMKNGEGGKEKEKETERKPG